MEDRAALDAQFVRSTLEGDPDAFAELVERYQRLVASIAWRYGVPREDIEDLVSEVFVKAYRNLHRFRPAHPFSTWLYRLAANHVVDHGRRFRKERGRSELPAQLVDDRPDPGERLDSGERTRLLRAALTELRPHFREVLFLVYVEGMKVNEVARELGLPQGTIKTRLMRGREALRKLLVRRHPEHFGG
jgi:RNA polymerase sigma-70 factor (ECF subfamily)